MAETRTDAAVYCVNHPQTETLLRCYRCGRPVCIKCVTRTPVGLICRDCLGAQRAGYYNAGAYDYAIIAAVGTIAAIFAGAIATVIPFFLFQIFYAPFAGGIVAEFIRRAIQKRRGRYTALIATLALVLGSLIGAVGLSFMQGVPGVFLQQPGLAILRVVVIRALFNIGFLIYLVLAAGTVYSRLRA